MQENAKPHSATLMYGVISPHGAQLLKEVTYKFWKIEENKEWSDLKKIKKKTESTNNIRKLELSRLGSNGAQFNQFHSLAETLNYFYWMEGGYYCDWGLQMHFS